MQPPGSPAKAWLMVTLCAVMMGLNYADKGILGFAAQPIMRDFKLSPVEFGYLGSSFFLLFAVSGIYQANAPLRGLSRRRLCRTRSADEPGARQRQPRP
jgi:hypothetical protein